MDWGKGKTMFNIGAYDELDWPDMDLDWLALLKR